MRILIGIPTYDRRVEIELLRILINVERQGKHHLDFMFPVSSHVSRNRNMICLKALEGNYDALLFLDSDIGIEEADFLDKMLETAYKLDAKIVGGAYLMKKTDETVYIAGYMNDEKFGNIRERPSQPILVDGVGTGIMLIYTEVLRKLDDPWFTIVDKPKLEVMPEDFEFCRKAKEAGFKIALDPRFNTNHYGQRSWRH